MNIALHIVLTVHTKDDVRRVVIVGVSLAASKSIFGALAAAQLIQRSAWREPVSHSDTPRNQLDTLPRSPVTMVVRISIQLSRTADPMYVLSALYGVRYQLPIPNYAVDRCVDEPGPVGARGLVGAEQFHVHPGLG